METNIALSKRKDLTELKSLTNGINFLAITALFIDLFTPYLIWKGYIPSETRWISHAAVAVMLMGSIARMLVFNYIPGSFWLIIGVSVLWSFVAVLRGQGVATTAWGLWLLFQFPFAGLFVYLQPNQPTRLAVTLRRAGLAILFLQLAVQLYQYAGGQAPGDNLAGLFGRNGTARAVIFTCLINCIFLGHWIISKRWIGLFISLVLGVAINVLGEVKLYPFGIAVLSVLGIVLFALRSRSIGDLLKYGFIVTCVVIGILAGFLILYNATIPSSQRRPLQSFITDPQVRDEYLNQTQRVYKGNGNYAIAMGRGYALSVGLRSLEDDAVTFLFGYGIGARSESQSLNTTGIGFSAGEEGVWVGTSLLVMMQELGMVGLVLLGGFFVWTVIALCQDIHRFPQSPLLELRYALVIFTTFWPVWLWYGSVWTVRASMLFYWVLLGYVLAEARKPLANMLLTDGEVMR